MNARALKPIVVFAGALLLWVGCSDDCPCHHGHSLVSVAVSVDDADAGEGPTATAPADRPPNKSSKPDRPVRPAVLPKTKLADSPDAVEAAPDNTNETDPDAEPQVPAGDADSVVAEVAKAAPLDSDRMQDAPSAAPIEGASETVP